MSLLKSFHAWPGKSPSVTVATLFIAIWSGLFVLGYLDTQVIPPVKNVTSINKIDILGAAASSGVTVLTWLIKSVPIVLISLILVNLVLVSHLKYRFRQAAKMTIFLTLLLFWLLVILSFSAEALYRVQELPVFIDKSTGAGIAQRGGNGASWVDYDGDGLVDLYASNSFFRNKGDGTFTQVTHRSGLNFNQSNGSKIGIFADYDNDGCQDLYLAKSTDEENFQGYSSSSPGASDRLYHNNCNGTFTDVTEAAGIKDDFHATSAAWADYDNDGYLDIYVTNWGVDKSEFYETVSPKNEGYIFEPNILYRNSGDGTFTNVTEQAGVAGIARCPNIDQLVKKESLALAKRLKHSYQPIWFDYDNDGDQDLFSATDTTFSPLYRNNGDGTFTDVTEEAGICSRGTSSNMGVATGDYDNDGWLDLYITNTGKNYLWRNNGNGTFSEIAAEAGTAELGNGWGTAFFDYNNDGWLDLLVVNGLQEQSPEFFAAAPPDTKRNNLDELYVNTGQGRFVAVGSQIGISIDKAKSGAAIADYNNDGFLDAYVTIVDSRGTTYGPLYTNQKNSNHWLTVKLRGTKSNRDGVGARLGLHADGKTQLREVQAGSSFQSQNSLWQTFGLGPAKAVDSLEIRWPSGTRQVLQNIPANQILEIIEEP